MGTLASQAEIGVWVQAPGTPLQESWGITLGKISRLYMQNPAIWCVFGRKMVRNAVHNTFLNNLTMGAAFPRVSPPNDPWLKWLLGGDWKRETWHRETIEIVEADIASLDNSAPYRKGGHRKTCFIVRVEAQYKLIFAAGSIIWAAHRLYVYSFT